MMGYKLEHDFLYCVGSMAKPTFESTLKEIPNLGMILSPMSWRNPFCHFACDNDVFNAFNKGILWNEEMHHRYMSMLEKLNIEQKNLLLWVLAPDAVGDWESTIKLAKKYVPILQSKGLPVAIALQDGCKFVFFLVLFHLIETHYQHHTFFVQFVLLFALCAQVESC